MKIYYASQSFYPHIGGVSTYLLNLCNEMCKKGNDVVEVHLRPSGEENSAELKGIEIKRVPKTPIDPEIMAKYSNFKEVVYKAGLEGDDSPEIEKIEGYMEYNEVNEYFGEEIKVLLEQNPADIVHIHDFHLLYAYKYVPRGTPLILTWHIPFSEKMSKNISEFLIKHLNEYDKVVFSSQEYIDNAITFGLKKEKCQLIYPIANTKLFHVKTIDKDEILEKYNIPKDSKIILSVQRIDPYKAGHEQLIKSLPAIKKIIPNIKLVFVGGDSLSNKLSKSRDEEKRKVHSWIEELGLKDDVIFTGTIDYYDLPNLYNASDLVALVSKNEGFGLAITEGMACGKPVVGTNVGGIPLQIKDGENGYLVNINDYEETAKKIVTILTNKKIYDSMSKKSLEMVENNFSISAGVEKHLILYNNLISEKDGHRKLEFHDISDFSALITDLDRTITKKPAKHEFDPKDFDSKLFERMKNANIDLFLATGRVTSYIKKLSKHFNLWRAIIAENGAVIYFPNTRKTLTFNTYYMTKAKQIIKNSGIPGCYVGKVIASIPLEKKEIIFEKLGDLIEHLEITTNIDEINIMPKGINKSIGVIMTMKYLNVNLNKTIVVGDGENDIEMYLNPGFKIALANSHPRLKELASQITKGESTDGIIEILDSLKS